MKTLALILVVAGRLFGQCVVSDVTNGTGEHVRTSTNANINCVNSKVTFTAPGIGAVPRSVADKAGDTLSVKDFGAIGNGSHDDTAAIQAAINAIDGTGGELEFPVGKYKITHPLTIAAPGNITLRGPGYRGGQNWATTGASATIQYLANGDVITFSNNTGQVRIEGLNFEGGVSGQYTGSHIHITDSTVGAGTYQIEVKDNRFVGKTNCVLADGQSIWWEIYIRNNVCDQQVDPIKFDYSALSGDPNGLWMNTNWVRNFTGVGIQTKGTINARYATSVHITEGAIDTGTGTSSIGILLGEVWNASVHHVDIEGLSGATSTSVQVRNSQTVAIDSDNMNYVGGGVDIVNSEGVVLESIWLHRNDTSSQTESITADVDSRYECLGFRFDGAFTGPLPCKSHAIVFPGIGFSVTNTTGTGTAGVDIDAGGAQLDATAYGLGYGMSEIGNKNAVPFCLKVNDTRYLCLSSTGGISISDGYTYNPDGPGSLAVTHVRQGTGTGALSLAGNVYDPIEAGWSWRTTGTTPIETYTESADGFGGYTGTRTNHPFTIRSNNTDRIIVGKTGKLTHTGLTLADWGSAYAGGFGWCIDCTPGSDPATGSGNGTFLKSVSTGSGLYKWKAD